MAVEHHPHPDAQTERRKPALTLSEAAQVTRSHRSTIRRRLDAGEFEWAWRDDSPKHGIGQGPWRVPVTDLQAAGFALYQADDEPEPEARPQHSDVAVDAGEVVELRGQVAELRERLAREEARREAAEQVASKSDQHVADLRRAMNVLEASVGGTATGSRPRRLRLGFWR